MPTDGQSFLLLLPSRGYCISGKEVEVRDSGSRHHQQCRCQAVPALRKRLSPYSTKTAWSSVLSSKTAWSSPPPKLCDPLPSPPKPPGPLSSPSEPCGPLSLWLPCLGLNPSASFPLQPHFRLLLQSVTPTSVPYSSSFTGLP